MWLEDCLFPSTDHAHPLHKCQKCWGNSCWKDPKSQTKAFRLSCPSSNCSPKASYSHPFWTIIVAGLCPCFFIAGLGPTESVAHSNWGSHQGRQMSWSSWWALIARHQHQLSKALLSAWSSCRNEGNLRHEYKIIHASFPSLRHDDQADWSVVVILIIMVRYTCSPVHTPSASTVSLQGSHCQIPSYSHPFWTIIVAGLCPCFFIAGLGPTESVAHSNWGSDQQTGRQMSWSSWWALIARHQHQLSKALLSAWSSCRNEGNLRHEYRISYSCLRFPSLRHDDQADWSVVVILIIMVCYTCSPVHTPSASTVSLQGSHCQIPSYSHPFWTIIVAGLCPCFFIAGLGPTESVAHSNWGSDQQTGRQMSWSSWWALIARHQHQLSKALLSAWSSWRAWRWINATITWNVVLLYLGSDWCWIDADCRFIFGVTMLWYCNWNQSGVEFMLISCWFHFRLEFYIAL